jgi:phospholipid-transporting ATPase
LDERYSQCTTHFSATPQKADYGSQVSPYRANSVTSVEGTGVDISPKGQVAQEHKMPDGVVPDGTAPKAGGSAPQGRVLVPRISDVWKAQEFNQSNLIRTTRFGRWTWLPESIYYQFRRFANRYFFVVCALSLADFSPKKWEPNVGTFAAVLVWTALKDWYEDMGRAKSDKAENQRPTRVMEKGGKFKDTKWQYVQCSDIVKVHKDEMIPTDMVIFCTSNEEKGHCYIDTKNLDGETNLKYKVANQALLGTKSYENVTINCEAPHENMMGFKGSVFVTGSGADVSPLSMDHMVLRGCSLRNTEWIMGFSCYCGPESKAMLNSREAPVKVPDMQHLLNKTLLGLALSLLSVVGILTVLGWFWQIDALDSHKYLQVDGFTFENDGMDFVTQFFSFFLTFSHLIPMSLYVALEITKLTLAYRILSDPAMVDDETKQSALPRNSDLLEELGQVEIVFSDKTGTLTCNKMEFVRASVAEQVVGPKDAADLVQIRAAMKSGNTPKFHLSGAATDVTTNKDLERYFLALAVCHAVVIDPDSGLYQGASPDEVALVQGAATAGVTLESINFGHMVIKMADGSKREYQLLEMLEFDSDRKRMSVVVENKHENKIEIIMKGADMMILQRVKKDGNGKPIGFENEDTPSYQQLNAFSKDGLRTLCVASKDLKDLNSSDECWYDGWKKRFAAAACAIDDREAMTAACGEEIEIDMDYLGITAVEDLLQEGVPDTIELLRQAGLAVWVLTGDKVETAIDIGYSCRLLDHSMKLCKLVNLTDRDSTETALRAVVAEIKKKTETGTQIGLAMDGFSMTSITTSGDPLMGKLFFEVLLLVQ